MYSFDVNIGDPNTPILQVPFAIVLSNTNPAGSNYSDIENFIGGLGDLFLLRTPAWNEVVEDPKDFIPRDDIIQDGFRYLGLLFLAGENSSDYKIQIEGKLYEGSDILQDIPGNGTKP